MTRNRTATPRTMTAPAMARMMARMTVLTTALPKA